MKIHGKYLLFLAFFCLLFDLNCIWADEKISAPLTDQASFGAAQLVGRLEDDRLVECSGMDISLAAGNLIWAINDNGHGPFLYALRIDGRSMGRVLVVGAQNRDWEGLDTFFWQGHPRLNLRRGLVRPQPQHYSVQVLLQDKACPTTASYSPDSIARQSTLRGEHTTLFS